MEVLNLKEFQFACLEVLCHFHDFCIENDIQYSLAGGTLIGAIRHKGFIPWDDDLDVIMTRPEYDRFCSIYQDSDEYKLFCLERGNSYINYARLCEMKKTRLVPYTAWAKEETGVYIDILPLDGINESKEDFLKVGDKLIELNALIYQLRGKKTRFYKEFTFFHKLKLIGKRIVYWKYDLEKSLDQYQSLIKEDFNKASYCGQKSFPDFIKKEYLPKEWTNETVFKEFEGHQLCVYKEYDSLLRNYYGDYMQLPPEDQRVGHNDNIAFRI